MTGYAHPEVLVDTQWLADRLHDPNIRVVEVDMSPEAYRNNHIVGAVFWNYLTDLFLPNFRLNLDPKAIASLLSKSGITPQTTAIAYGSYPGTSAWVFWLLNLFGHQNVRVLNGGHQTWIAEGRPVTSELATFATTHYNATPIDENLRVLHDEVREAIGQSDRVILDVRTLPEYCGKLFFTEPPKGEERAGHIPRSVHLEHLLALNENGTFKSFEELQALYHSQGITPDKEIFPYCTVGGRSGFVWFVLKYLLGYPCVRNYEGSWNEWSRLPDALIEIT